MDTRITTDAYIVSLHSHTIAWNTVCSFQISPHALATILLQTLGCCFHSHLLVYVTQPTLITAQVRRVFSCGFEKMTVF